MNDFFFVLLLLGLLSFMTMVIVTIIFAVMRKKVRLKLMLIPIVAIVIGFFGFGLTVKPSENNETTIENEMAKAIERPSESTMEETTTSAEETTTLEETTTQEETITEPEETTIEAELTVTEAESEDEFKSSCQEIGYKKLLRTPDDYVGQRIVITAEVQQIIDGGLFDDSKYYRVQTDNDDSGYFFDDEYFMYDERADDDMKILDDDVLKIYGEFTGLETMKRVITGSKDEVPVIKAYYIELISE